MHANGEMICLYMRAGEHVKVLNGTIYINYHDTSQLMLVHDNKTCIKISFFYTE